MTVSDFAQLAQEMRQLGATHVKVGDWEVSFPFPTLDVQEPPVPANDELTERMRDWLRDQYGSST